jgi:DeoR/GlpR family transcriptional regulator of sugar metabolism
VVLLLDTDKINKNTIFTYANLKDIDILVAEGPLPSDIIHEAE